MGRSRKREVETQMEPSGGAARDGGSGAAAELADELRPTELGDQLRLAEGRGADMRGETK